MWHSSIVLPDTTATGVRLGCAALASEAGAIAAIAENPPDYSGTTSARADRHDTE